MDGHLRTIVIAGGGFAGTTLGRKVRIGVERTRSLYFPADITRLRFTRTDEVSTVSGRLLKAPQD